MIMNDVDELFDALADGDRRRLLLALLDHDSRDVPAPDSSESPPKRDRDDEEPVRDAPTDSWAIAGAEADVVRIRVVHIPKLVEYGFVEWDPEERVVAKGPRFEEARPLLEPLSADREPPPDE